MAVRSCPDENGCGGDVESLLPRATLSTAGPADRFSVHLAPLLGALRPDHGPTDLQEQHVAHSAQERLWKLVECPSHGHAMLGREGERMLVRFRPRGTGRIEGILIDAVVLCNIDQEDTPPFRASRRVDLGPSTREDAARDAVRRAYAVLLAIGAPGPQARGEALMRPLAILRVDRFKVAVQRSTGTGDLRLDIEEERDRRIGIDPVTNDIPLPSADDVRSVELLLQSARRRFGSSDEMASHLAAFLRRFPPAQRATDAERRSTESSRVAGASMSRRAPPENFQLRYADPASMMD